MSVCRAKLLEYCNICLLNAQCISACNKSVSKKPKRFVRSFGWLNVYSTFVETTHPYKSLFNIQIYISLKTSSSFLSSSSRFLQRSSADFCPLVVLPSPSRESPHALDDCQWTYVPIKGISRIGTSGK
jgi:hypothetical protein